MDTKTPNLTLIFLAVAFVAGCGIVGGVFLTIFDKDATAFYGFFTVTLTTIVGFGTLARSQGKMAESIETVTHNVNGRMSKLIELATSQATTRKDLKTIERIGVESGVIETVEPTYAPDDVDPLSILSNGQRGND